MKYQVIVEEYYNDEFGFRLLEGEILNDGDLEPDLMANLVAQEVLVAEVREEPKVEESQPKSKARD